MNRLRQANIPNFGSEFPLVLGKDFSGVVVRTGKAVSPSRLKPGDEVKLVLCVVCFDDNVMYSKPSLSRTLIAHFTSTKFQISRIIFLYNLTILLEIPDNLKLHPCSLEIKVNEVFEFEDTQKF